MDRRGLGTEVVRRVSSLSGERWCARRPPFSIFLGSRGCNGTSVLLLSRAAFLSFPRFCVYVCVHASFRMSVSNLYPRKRIPYTVHSPVAITVIRTLAQLLGDATRCYKIIYQVS